MRSLRTWEGLRAYARGLLAYVLRSENLHRRHARSCWTNRKSFMSIGTCIGAWSQPATTRAGVSDRGRWRVLHEYCCRIRAAEPRGYLKVCGVWGADRCQPFARRKPKLNTKSPRAGGGSKVDIIFGCGPVPLPRRDFFSRAHDFSRLDVRRAAISLGNSTPRVGERVQYRHLFSLGPRGWSKVRDLSIADRWVRCAYFVAELRKSFFCRAARVNGREKTSRNSGWGGSVRT
jgi:hypothetical protein